MRKPNFIEYIPDEKERQVENFLRYEIFKKDDKRRTVSNKNYLYVTGLKNWRKG